MTPTHLGFEEYVDLVTQISISHHYWVIDGRLETFSAPLSLRVAVRAGPHGATRGMTLRERWSDWNREPFTSDSRRHVSVWEKAA